MNDPIHVGEAPGLAVETQEGPPRLVECGDRIEIHLNRPSVHNRLEPSDILLLSQMLRGPASEAKVRLVTFRARGPSFCSGINLKALGAPGARSEFIKQALGLFEGLPDLIEALPAPTLFVLNGPAYGGAMDVVLAGCFRIGAAATTFSVAAPGRGALYSPPGIARAVRLLGAQMARRIFILGQTITSDELLGAGGLDRIASGDDVEAVVAEFEQAIGARAPLPLRAAKRIIDDAARGRLELDAWQAMRDEISRSADLLEGMTAWHERRAPRFEGR